MSAKKGFTLIEIIVVLVIIGILAAIAEPNYVTYLQQGVAKAAQNNLTTIYNAQSTYYYTNNTYCINPNCTSLNSINTLLSLNINDTSFNYTCGTDPNGSKFLCTATEISNSNLILSVTSNAIVLPGGVGCATNAGASCNPSCSSTNNPSYCPTS